MADVASEAGVSRALVNHYFGSKRELFVETLRVVTADAPQLVRTDLDLPVEEMVAANLSSWLDFVEANRHTTLAISGGGQFGSDPDTQDAVSDMRDALVDRMLSNHFGDDAEIPENARLALRAFSGMISVAILDWLDTGRATREEVHALLVLSMLAIVREVIPRLPDSSQVTNRVVSG